MKFSTQLCGADVDNENDVANRSFFRLHEAFQQPFQKLLSQGTYVIFVAAMLDVLNIQVLHSANLEQMIEVSLVAFMLWILVGIFLIYYAQGIMKDWYQIEIVAHDPVLLETLHNKHKNMYAKRDSGLPNEKKLNNLRV